MTMLESEAVFVVGHAPHLFAPQADKDMFWDSIGDTLQLVRTKFPTTAVFVLIDANGRVGSVQSSAIGPREVDRENENGTLLRMLLEANSMKAANSFFDSGYTWRSGRDTTARIDYICCQDDALKHFRSCTANSGIDLSYSAREDHRALCAEVGISSFSSTDITIVGSKNYN